MSPIMFLSINLKHDDIWGKGLGELGLDEV